MFIDGQRRKRASCQKENTQQADDPAHQKINGGPERESATGIVCIHVVHGCCLGRAN
jgi:hypothetical protein